MKNKETTLSEFITYIEGLKGNNFPYGRLLNILRSLCGYIYDFDSEERLEDIRDFTDKLFMKQRNVGEKTLADFKELRANYLQYIYITKSDRENEAGNNIKTYETEKFSCWLRSDISETLKTIEDETCFVERALLEKFERDGIEMVNHIFNEKNETT